MKKGNIVLVNFTGKDKASGKVFDTTQEKIAKENGMNLKNTIYKPVPVVIGKKELLQALDSHLEGMKVGEKKTIALKAAEAFGEKNPDMVRLIALNDFRKQNLNPVVGMPITAAGMTGRVQSVSGGRVRVDFNHELAGKDVEYELEIVKELTEAGEQAIELAQKVFPELKKEDFKIEKEALEVKLDSKLTMNEELHHHIMHVKPEIARTVLENVSKIKEVKFVETFNAESFPKNENGKDE